MHSVGNQNVLVLFILKPAVHTVRAFEC